MKNILMTHRFSAGEYMLGLVEETPSFPYAFPVFSPQGTFVGSINGIFKLSSYVDLYRKYNLPGNSFLGLVDRNGRRLFFYPPKETNAVGEKIKATVWQKMEAGPEQGSLIETNSDGVERLTAYRKLRLAEDQEPYLYVVYATPLAPLIAESGNLILQSVLILVLVTLGALFSTIFLYPRLFGRRLRKIVETTERIRQGDLGARVGTADPSPDLGTIAQALDLMAQELQARLEQEGADKQRIAQALKEKEILLKEVHHRVKNNLQLILSMVRLQADTGASTAQFREALEGRIGSMALIHEMLYQTEDSARMDLRDYLQQLTSLLLRYAENPTNIRLEQRTEQVFVVLDQAIPFGLLVNELVTNTLKHGVTLEKEAVLRVYLERQGPNIHLEVGDNGPGLPSDFDPNAPTGIGLQIAQALAVQLGGLLRWAPAEGEGSRFWVDFPCREASIEPISKIGYF
jgi:two-component sensor histidine kinase